MAGLAALVAIWNGRPDSALYHGGIGAVVSVILLAIATTFPNWFD